MRYNITPDPDPPAWDAVEWLLIFGWVFLFALLVLEATK